MVSEPIDDKGGVYCEDCDIARQAPPDSTENFGIRPRAIDPSAAERLWIPSKALSGGVFK